MKHMELALIFGGVILFVCGYIAIGLAFDAMRRKRMGEFAARIGFTWHRNDPFDLPRRFAGLDALERGHSHGAYNVLSGERNGRPIFAFDYRYRTGRGKSRTWRFSAVIVETGVRAPWLLIRPENFIDKIAGAIGFAHIDFENKEFSRKFFVKCEDQAFARAVITPAVIEHLLAAPGWSIEFRGAAMVVHRGDRKLSPAGFERALAFAGEFPIIGGHGAFPQEGRQRTETMPVREGGYQGASPGVPMSIKITFNGKEYESVDDMPPEERQTYERMMAMIENKGQASASDVPEGGPLSNVATSFKVTTRIVFNGKEYGSVEEMPAADRQTYERAMNMSGLAMAGATAPPAQRPAAPASAASTPPAVSATPGVSQPRDIGRIIIITLAVLLVVLLCVFAVFMIRKYV
jgi:hypothetical protein